MKQHQTKMTIMPERHKLESGADACPRGDGCGLLKGNSVDVDEVVFMGFEVEQISLNQFF